MGSQKARIALSSGLTMRKAVKMLAMRAILETSQKIWLLILAMAPKNWVSANRRNLGLSPDFLSFFHFWDFFVGVAK